MSEPVTSPLHERHLARGAKLAGFGGWSMPLEYAGSGVVKEHQAVRTAVGLFDVSHLGTGTVRGPGAAAYVGATLSNDLGRIGPGRAQYTLCCDPQTGGILDDLIVYLHAEDHVFLVPNAANSAEVLGRLAASAPPEVEVRDEHRAHAVLAVQGPRSDEVLSAVGLPSGHAYMSFAEGTVEDAAVTVCRTGYTGERGYELVCGVAAAGGLWDALLAAGAGSGILPCGLGARDTLRTEMGYPLHGQDIGPSVTPVQARLGWAVGWDKGEFWGREPLVAEREHGAARLLWGLRSTGRSIPRPGMRVLVGEDPVGAITSGTFSPSLRVGIGLALLDRSVGEGDAVTVDVRGRREAYAVTRPPFVDSHVR